MRSPERLFVESYISNFFMIADDVVSSFLVVYRSKSGHCLFGGTGQLRNDFVDEGRVRFVGEEMHDSAPLKDTVDEMRQFAVMAGGHVFIVFSPLLQEKPIWFSRGIFRDKYLASQQLKNYGGEEISQTSTISNPSPSVEDDSPISVAPALPCPPPLRPPSLPPPALPPPSLPPPSLPLPSLLPTSLHSPIFHFAKNLSIFCPDETHSASRSISQNLQSERLKYPCFFTEDDPSPLRIPPLDVVPDISLSQTTKGSQSHSQDLSQSRQAPFPFILSADTKSKSISSPVHPPSSVTTLSLSFARTRTSDATHSGRSSKTLAKDEGQKPASVIDYNRFRESSPGSRPNEADFPDSQSKDNVSPAKRARISSQADSTCNEKSIFCLTRSQRAKAENMPMNESHPWATKTLLIENFARPPDPESLRSFFVRFGTILSCDFGDTGNSSITIEYESISSVVVAIASPLSRRFNYENLKLSFAPPQRTSKTIWIRFNPPEPRPNESELERLFVSQFGPVGDLKIAPCRPEALITFLSIESSMNAFHTLHGSKWRGMTFLADYTSEGFLAHFYGKFDKSDEDLFKEKYVTDSDNSMEEFSLGAHPVAKRADVNGKNIDESGVKYDETKELGRLNKENDKFNGSRQSNLKKNSVSIEKKGNLSDRGTLSLKPLMDSMTSSSASLTPSMLNMDIETVVDVSNATSCLHISRIDIGISDMEIREIFSSFGEIRNVKMKLLDQMNKVSSKMVFIFFENPVVVAQIIKYMNGKRLGSEILKLSYGTQGKKPSETQMKMLKNIVQKSTKLAEISRVIKIYPIPPGVSQTELKNAFDLYGTITAVEIKPINMALDRGYIYYADIKSAFAAVANANDSELMGSQINVEFCMEDFGNLLWISNIPATISEEIFLNIIHSFGDVMRTVFDAKANVSVVEYKNIAVAFFAVDKLRDMELAPGHTLHIDMISHDKKEQNIQLFNIPSTVLKVITPTRKLFVQGLKPECSSAETKCIFERYGNVFHVDKFNEYALVYFLNEISVSKLLTNGLPYGNLKPAVNKSSIYLWIGNVGSYSADNIGIKLSEFGPVKNLDCNQDHGVLTFCDQNESVMAFESIKKTNYFGIRIDYVTEEFKKLFQDKRPRNNYDCIDEYNQDASRKITIHNLNINTLRRQIRRVFKPYGNIIRIDLQHGSQSALIIFDKISSALSAARELDGMYLDGHKIRIQLDKPNPTKALWLYPVPNNSCKLVHVFFSKFGSRPNEVICDNSKPYAVALFENEDNAIHALVESRGSLLINSKIQVDFISEDEIPYFKGKVFGSDKLSVNINQNTLSENILFHSNADSKLMNSVENSSIPLLSLAQEVQRSSLQFTNPPILTNNSVGNMKSTDSAKSHPLNRTVLVQGYPFQDEARLKICIHRDFGNCGKIERIHSSIDKRDIIITFVETVSVSRAVDLTANFLTLYPNFHLICMDKLTHSSSEERSEFNVKASKKVWIQRVDPYVSDAELISFFSEFGPLVKLERYQVELIVHYFFANSAFQAVERESRKAASRVTFAYPYLSRHLCVDYVLPHTTHTDLVHFFQQVGPVRTFFDHHNCQALITFESQTEALMAREYLHGAKLNSRRIAIDFVDEHFKEKFLCRLKKQNFNVEVFWSNPFFVEKKD